jgi:hypothetical protein
MEVEGSFVCEDAGFQMLPLLCPYLSKHPDKTPPNDGSLNAFHGPTSPAAWTPAVATGLDVLGRLAKSEGDREDNWTIDLKAPCFVGSCAQDNDVPADYQLDPRLNGQVFGCDLWVEVTGISEAPPPGP